MTARPEGRVPRRREHVRLEHHHADSVLIVEPDQALTLNSTALALWELCDGSTTVAEMVNALDLFFDAERAEIDNAVVETLDELTDLGAVDWVPAGRRPAD